MEGKIIVIEGTDGSGKKTQSDLLEKRLNELGYKCKTLSFPMYDTATGKIVGGPLLGKEEICPSYFKEEGVGNLDPHVASLYYAADRFYNINKAKEYLEKGYFVILDRYTTSNLAHQGGKIEDKNARFDMYQWIDKLEYWLLGLPKPDITVFLHVPFEYTLEMRKTREFSDEVERDEKYMRNSEIAYIELAELYNWEKITCVVDNKLKTIEEINNEITSYILKKINNKDSRN